MSTEAAAAVVAEEVDGTLQPGSRWRLHPRVAVRPEPFGALLYHYDTRRLTFVKDRRLLAALRALDEHADVAAACTSAGIEDSEQPRYLAALERLARTQMLVHADPEGRST